MAPTLDVPVLFMLFALKLFGNSPLQCLLPNLSQPALIGRYFQCLSGKVEHLKTSLKIHTILAEALKTRRIKNLLLKIVIFLNNALVLFHFLSII